MALARYAHLRQFHWKPGQSGNPGGKLTGRHSFEALVNRELNRRVEAEADGYKGTVAQRRLLAKRFVEAMLDGNVALIKMYLDRDWPVEALGMQDEGAPLQIEAPAPTPDEQRAQVAELARILLEARVIDAEAIDVTPPKGANGSGNGGA